jgi:hypothetical protein
MWAAADDVRPATAVEHCVAALLRNSSGVMAHGPVLVKLQGQVDLVERANEVHLADWEVAERARAFTKGIRLKGWCIRPVQTTRSRERDAWALPWAGLSPVFADVPFGPYGICKNSDHHLARKMARSHRQPNVWRSTPDVDGAT